VVSGDVDEAPLLEVRDVHKPVRVEPLRARGRGARGQRRVFAVRPREVLGLVGDERLRKSRRWGA